MLTIRMSGVESFDESSQEFTTQGGTILELEHSLVSLSKWESKYEKPFLGKSSKSKEEVLDYIRCMLLTENPPGDFLNRLSNENVEAVNAYVDRKMTATWFSEVKPESRSSETI